MVDDERPEGNPLISVQTEIRDESGDVRPLYPPAIPPDKIREIIKKGEEKGQRRLMREVTQDLK